MKHIDRLAWRIVLKYVTLSIIIVILWAAKVLHFLFWIWTTIYQEFFLFLEWLAEPTQAGAADYWSAYWIYWAGIYLVLIVAFIVWYFAIYRHKRPYLEVGGGREGRILWIKGLRRGLVYDAWDAKNYLAWKLKKNRLRKVPSRISDIPDTDRVIPRTWPDPLAIPLGRPTSRVIIYYSRPWSLRVHKLTIPDRIDLRSAWFKIQIPEGYIVNIPDRLFPGEILQAVAPRPYSRAYQRGRMREDLMDLLDGTREAVQKSAAANPQLVHRDYEDGSFPLLSPEEVKTID
jgi:hypothetical protein